MGIQINFGNYMHMNFPKQVVFPLNKDVLKQSLTNTLLSFMSPPFESLSIHTGPCSLNKCPSTFKKPLVPTFTKVARTHSCIPLHYHIVSLLN